MTNALKFFFVLAALSLSASFLAGCTQNAPAPSATPLVNATANPTLEPSATPAPTASVIAENKTGNDKVNESILAAVKDGNYKTEVTYAYHKGVTTVDINITVKDGTVTDASVTPVNADPMSTRIVGGFNGALPDVVIGKKIADIHLSGNVAGSSLTSAAFQQYVDGLVAGQ